MPMTDASRVVSPDRLALNPHFKTQLPHLVEQIAQAWVLIEPPLTEVKTTIESLRTFLQFEIDKASLELERVEQDAGHDPGYKRRVEKRLELLILFHVSIEPGQLTASADFLEDLNDTLRALLQDDDERAAEAA